MRVLGRPFCICMCVCVLLKLARVVCGNCPRVLIELFGFGGGMTESGEELSLGLLCWLRLPYVFYTSSDLVMHKGIKY